MLFSWCVPFSRQYTHCFFVTLLFTLEHDNFFVVWCHWLASLQTRRPAKAAYISADSRGYAGLQLPVGPPPW